MGVKIGSAVSLRYEGDTSESPEILMIYLFVFCLEFVFYNYEKKNYH